MTRYCEKHDMEYEIKCTECIVESSASPACYADGEEVWSKWDYGDHWLINNERFGIEVPKYVGDEMADKIYNALRTIWVDRDA